MVLWTALIFIMVVLALSCSSVVALRRYTTAKGRYGMRMMSTKRVVFLGTPDVAAKSLEMIVERSKAGKGTNSSEDPDYDGFEVVAVVSQPPAPSGRKMKLTPSPVQLMAESLGIPLHAPAKAKDEDFLAMLEGLKPDLCITAAYGNFLPKRFLAIPKFGTLNIHPSLLPLYRGAAPVQRCLENGDTVTGITVAETVLKMDAGPVVRQEEYQLQVGLSPSLSPSQV